MPVIYNNYCQRKKYIILSHESARDKERERQGSKGQRSTKEESSLSRPEDLASFLFREQGDECPQDCRETAPS